MRTRPLFQSLGLVILACWLTPAEATDFNLGDSSTQITLGDFLGIAAGDTINFRGNITVGPPPVAILLSGPPPGLNLNFEAGSMTNATGPNGLALRYSGDLGGSFLNDGTIFGRLGGVRITGMTSGSFVNNGTISNSPPGGGPSGAVRFVGSITSTGFFLNTGSITGNDSFAVVFAPGADIEGRFENRGLIQGIGPGPAAAVLARTLASSGTFINSGSIIGFADGVFFDGSLNGTFINNSTITSGPVGGFLDPAGVHVNGNVNGIFMNRGTISGDVYGVQIEGEVSGTIINSGSIIGLAVDGLAIEDDVEVGALVRNEASGVIRGAIDGLYVGDDLQEGGRIENYGQIYGAEDGLDIDEALEGVVFNMGRIWGEEDGIDIDSDFDGTIFNNCGIIEGISQSGIEAGSFEGGNIRNHGGRIQGSLFSIEIRGGSSGTVVLSGPSHIVGAMLGGGANETLRFESMRGISAAKQSELAALAASDPSTGSVVLFGETISWQQFEDIQADLATLESYQDLITGPDLGGFAHALDNVLGLNDDFREYLKVLNDADAFILNDLAANASGQNLQNTLRDFGREQDTNFFHLFSNQFSSLRGHISGQLVSDQGAVRNTGFLTQEVQVGAVAIDPGESSNMWMASYIGSASQDANGSRAAADYDNTSILLGGGTEVAEGWYLGGFGGYTRNEGQIDGFGSYVENKGGWFGANAQYRRGDTFANFVAALGGQDVKSIRRDFQGNRFQGDTDSLGGFLYAQAGRDYFFDGGRGGAKVTPYLGFTLSSQIYDGFAETGGTVSTALRFSDESIGEFQSVLGLSVAGYHDLRGGWIRPRADLAWWHAFNGSNSYGAGLVAPGLLPGFNVSSPAANEHRGVFQVGMEFGCDRLEGWTFKAGYFGVLGSNDYDSHGGTFGARLDF